MKPNFDFEGLKSRVIQLCGEVAVFIENELGKVDNKDIEVKEMNSLVSYVDKTAEAKLVDGLSSMLPGASFITEEDTVKNHNSDLVWIIDPLDGTNNYLHQIPHFAISVALQADHQIVLGVIFDIMRRECYHSSLGNGAFLNHSAIQVSKVTRLSNALIATGFPYSNEYDADPYVRTLLHWLKNTRGVRRFGSAALDMAYVACGRFDAYYEANLNIWDIAAGLLLVKEAQGQISDYTGGNNYWTGNQIVATNTDLHEDVLHILGREFSDSVYPI